MLTVFEELLEQYLLKNMKPVKAIVSAYVWNKLEDEMAILLTENSVAEPNLRLFDIPIEIDYQYRVLIEFIFEG